MLSFIDLTNFTAGELSPRMRGRKDVAKYWNGCESLFNMVTQPQGGATMRPGTKFVVATNNQAAPVRLLPFIFSTVQAYVLEAGPDYLRINRADGQVVSGGSPVQVATPYAQGDLAALKYFQSADTMFLCNGSFTYPVRALTRSSDTSWSIAPYVFLDGPYLSQNVSATSLTASASVSPGGATTVTASSIVGINAGPGNTGVGFVSGDVGRLLRLQVAGVWYWGTITAVASATVCTWTAGSTMPNGAFGGLAGQAWAATTQYEVGVVVTNGGHYYTCTVAGISAASGGPTGTTANTAIVDGAATWNYLATAPSLLTTVWSLGAWSVTTGYPGAGMFWQGRMMLLGSATQPNAINGSCTGNFQQFSPSAQDGSVSAANALQFIIEDDQVNAGNWLATAGSAQAMQLGIGTTGGEQILQAGTTAQALAPDNVQAYRETSLGSAANVQPLRIGKSLLFPNRTGTKLHEWTFTWQVNGYLGPDILVLSEHLIRLGLGRIVYQQSPHSIIWGIVAGGLVGVTYIREQDIVAPHRHVLGGQYYGGPPIVEDLAVIPSPDGAYDELWLTVARTVGGAVFRGIEVLTRFNTGALAENGWYLDCALASTLTAPAATATVTGLTPITALDQPTLYGGTGTLTLTAAPATPLAAGQILRMNGGIGGVTAVASTTQCTVAISTPMSSVAPSASGAWSLTAPVSSVSGTGYLSGETVGVVGDGINYGTQTASGSVQLSPLPASYVVCGLPYSGALVTVPLAEKAGQVAAGLMEKPGPLYVRLDATVGGSVGTRVLDPFTLIAADTIEALPQRQVGQPANGPMTPMAQVARISPTGAADFEGRVIVAQTEPMPLTVLAIGVRLDVGETAQ